MSTKHAPSLFPDEWRARFGVELQQLLDATPATDHAVIEAEFLQHHPPIFQGVYLSPTIALGTTLGREPRLMWQNDQLWIALWSGQDAEQVLHVIPIPHHRLLALVLRHELVIVRADEFERVCGKPKTPQTSTGREGTHPHSRVPLD